MKKKGRRIRLSNGRRLVDDVIHMAQKMPTAAFLKTFDVSDIGKLRRKTSTKISWNVLMMKAYGIVCDRQPMLRQLYVSLPWSHIYEHYENVCMLTLSREYDGEERLLFARFGRPEEFSLVQLQEQYDHFRFAPIDDIKQFRHQIAFAKFPTIVRRFGWWCLFHLWPQKRASHMGTYGMSISQYKGACGTKHLGPNTTILGVDPLPRRGKSQCLLTFDHRILDGKPAIDVLDDLGRALREEIVLELKEMLLADGKNPEAILNPTPDEISEESSHEVISFRMRAMQNLRQRFSRFAA